MTRPKMLSLDFAIETEAGEIVVHTEVLYRPGDPGKTVGPPEECCPPEPGEFEAVRFSIRDVPADAWQEVATALKAAGIGCPDWNEVLDLHEAQCEEVFGDE